MVDFGKDFLKILRPWADQSCRVASLKIIQKSNIKSSSLRVDRFSKKIFYRF